MIPSEVLIRADVDCEEQTRYKRKGSRYPSDVADGPRIFGRDGFVLALKRFAVFSCFSEACSPTAVVGRKHGGH